VSGLTHRGARVTPGPLGFSAKSMLSSGGYRCTEHLMVGSPSCCPWGPRPSRPSRLWCQPSPSRRAGRSGSSQTRLPNQERHHLHLLDGLIGSQSDAALRVGLAAIVGLVQRLAGLRAGELGQHQCRRTWLASVQMDLAGISAGKHGQRPHGPVPVAIITSGCARAPHCVFGGARGNKHRALSSA
jgi:hypothetical protein